MGLRRGAQAIVTITLKMRGCGGMSKLPSMPVWVADFFSKTDHLSNEEQWAYLKLMMKTWVRNCRAMPDSDADIARLLNMGIKRWRRIRPRIEPFFDLSESSWVQSNLENVFREASERNAKIVSAARLGGIAKSNKYMDLTPAIGTAAAMPIKIKIKEEDSEEASASSGADAPADPCAIDPVKELWDRGLLIVGPRNRALLGKLCKEHGNVAVMEAIVTTEQELPVDPLSFLLGCLKRYGENGHGRKLSPGEKLALGFAAAPDAYEARERARAAAAEPLLDAERSSSDAAGAGSGLDRGSGRVPDRLH